MIETICHYVLFPMSGETTGSLLVVSYHLYRLVQGSVCTSSPAQSIFLCLLFSRPFTTASVFSYRIYSYQG